MSNLNSSQQLIFSFLIADTAGFPLFKYQYFASNSKLIFVHLDENMRLSGELLQRLMYSSCLLLSDFYSLHYWVLSAFNYIYAFNILIRSILSFCLVFLSILLISGILQFEDWSLVTSRKNKRTRPTHKTRRHQKLLTEYKVTQINKFQFLAPKVSTPTEEKEKEGNINNNTAQMTIYTSYISEK